MSKNIFHFILIRLILDSTYLFIHFSIPLYLDYLFSFSIQGDQRSPGIIPLAVKDAFSIIQEVFFKHEPIIYHNMMKGIFAKMIHPLHCTLITALFFSSADTKS
jgi:hypothetical protein